MTSSEIFHTGKKAPKKKRKKSEKDSSEHWVRAAANAAHKLTNYVNANYSPTGRPVYMSITPDKIDDYVYAFEGKKPSFANKELNYHDRSVLMGYDWDLFKRELESNPLSTDPLPAYYGLPTLSRIYAIDAAIHILDTDRQIITFNGRLNDQKLAKLSSSDNAAREVLDSIVQTFRRKTGVSIDAYVIFEFKDGNGGTLPHPHGSLLIDRSISKDQVRAILKQVFGKRPGGREVTLRDTYPRRCGYITKQALYSAYNSEQAGFASDRYFAATNKVRSRAKSLWDDEIRYTDKGKSKDLVVENGVERHAKIRSRLLDLYIGTRGAPVDPEDRVVKACDVTCPDRCHCLDARSDDVEADEDEETVIAAELTESDTPSVSDDPPVVDEHSGTSSTAQPSSLLAKMKARPPPTEAALRRSFEMKRRFY